MSLHLPPINHHTISDPALPRSPTASRGAVLSRRGALLGLAGTLALGPTRIALAAGPDPERRLVVVILRGAMDGLSVVHPYGDPAYRETRGILALPEPGQEGGLLDLGGFFGLHPAMPRLHALYQAGQMLPVHAVAGPYRSRSHFEAQDMLESGAAQRLSSGWLNRALSAEAHPQRAMAVGAGVPLLLRGAVQVGTFAPNGAGHPTPELMQQIAALNAHDPITGPALLTGLRMRGFSMETLGDALPRNGGDLAALAMATGRLLAAPDGPRVAAVEVDGWDTHVGQVPRLAAQLGRLDAGLDALRQGLGAAWSDTMVLTVTEFGRTAHINGTGGTDHGTAGVALLLGGVVAGGRVLADWPGLGVGKLFENRDLQPSRDLRALAKAALAAQLRLPALALARAFPGSEGLAPEAGLLRT